MLNGMEGDYNFVTYYFLSIIEYIIFFVSLKLKNISASYVFLFQYVNTPYSLYCLIGNNLILKGNNYLDYRLKKEISVVYRCF